MAITILPKEKLLLKFHLNFKGLAASSFNMLDKDMKSDEL